MFEAIEPIWHCGYEALQFIHGWLHMANKVGTLPGRKIIDKA
jgi:hypothetical protein